MFEAKELRPRAALSVPVVLLLNAQNPTAVLSDAVLQYRASLPIATFELPAVLLNKEVTPNATLLIPVVFLHNA